MRTITAFVTPFIVCVSIGFLAGEVQAESIRTWYPLLNKPSITPPNTVFPIAWGIIYVLTSISLGLVIRSAHQWRSILVALFVVQQVLNFLWCLTFFAMQSPMLGMIVIILLELSIVAYMLLARPVNLWSMLLYIPIFLWIGFASYLNAYIWLNN